MEPLIVGKKLVKTFGTDGEKSVALNHVDVEIAKGEFVAVMGASGSGKSTLLFALSATDSIDSGSVRFGEAELNRLAENQLADIRRTKMGFVFQQPTMLKSLNLLDNIVLPAAHRGGAWAAQATARAQALMSKTGIAGLAARSITEVSGGQLQRAGICRALINGPEILFADEPTGALNSKASDEIMELLCDINNGGTAILLVTHDARVAARARRVLFMKDGAILSELSWEKGPAQELEQKTEKITACMVQAGI